MNRSIEDKQILLTMVSISFNNLNNIGVWWITGCLFIISGACTRSRNDMEMHIPKFSIWQLDVKTHQNIIHQCVVTDFKSNPATFTLKRLGDDLLLQFNGMHYVWVSSAGKKHFYAKQLMKSSNSGRFCGNHIEVSIYFIVTGSDQNQIKGIWRTVNCDFCPKIEFIAHKIE